MHEINPNHDAIQMNENQFYSEVTIVLLPFINIIMYNYFMRIWSEREAGLLVGLFFYQAHFLYELIFYRMNEKKKYNVE